MCTGGCGPGPPEQSRRTKAIRAVESLQGGRLGWAKEAGVGGLGGGGIDWRRGRERSPAAGGERQCLQSGGEIVRFI